MGLKETIAKIRATVEEQISRFPVRCLGLEIGEAREWEDWTDDEVSSYRLYYGLKPIPELSKILGDWDNILIDYDEGYIYKFEYDSKEDTIDVEWDFPLELLVVLATAG